MKTTGERIKSERQLKGWSQQKLADEISRIKKEKISRAAVAQWENGDSKSQKPENLFAAAEALGINPRWVVSGVGDKTAMEANLAQKPYETTTHKLLVEENQKQQYRQISEVAYRVDALDQEMQRLVAGFLDLIESSPRIKKSTDIENPSGMHKNIVHDQVGSGLQQIADTLSGKGKKKQQITGK